MWVDRPYQERQTLRFPTQPTKKESVCAIKKPLTYEGAALKCVRQDDDFPDPILRLGKSGNTYTRLISQASQEKIRNYHRAAKTLVKNLEEETQTTNQEIRVNPFLSWNCPWPSSRH